MGRAGALPSILLAVAIATAPQQASAQEQTVEFAPREEMIDAIMTYAGSGGCKALRDVFGPTLEAIAKGLAAAGSGQLSDDACKLAVSLGDLSLHRAQDATLIEICTRNGIMSCRKRVEASAGAPVLTFHASVGVKGATATAAWSPDNRFLVVYDHHTELTPLESRRSHTLVVDIEQQQVRPLLTDGIGVWAVAWSPDGKYIAANRQRAIHLFAADTLEEKGSIPGAGSQCGIHKANRMAFTVASNALWVACGGFFGGSLTSIAIKVGVPSMQIEDRLFATPHRPDWKGQFRTTAIAQLGDDLLLAGQALGRWGDPEVAVRSFNLRTKEPLHLPVIYEAPEKSESYPEVFSTDDLSGVLIRFYSNRPDGAEVLSTQSSKRMTKLHPKTAMPGRSLGAPNRIPASALHIEEQRFPTSPRRTLQVIDSRTGATVQEIGPVTGWSDEFDRKPGSLYAPSVLVSPDGKMVAHFGSREIRFYRIDANAVASLSAKKQ